MTRLTLLQVDRAISIALFKSPSATQCAPEVTAVNHIKCSFAPNLYVLASWHQDFFAFFHSKNMEHENHRNLTITNDDPARYGYGPPIFSKCTELHWAI